MSIDSIYFRCGKCGKSLVAPKSDAGRAVSCPSCTRKLNIPRFSQTGATPRGTAPQSDVSAAEATVTAKANEPQAVSADKPSAGHSMFGLFLLGLILGLTLIAFYAGNIVTRLFVALVFITALNGYWMGAAKITATLLGMLLAVPLATPVGRWFEGLTTSLVGTTGLMNRMIAIGVGAFAVIVVLGIVLTYPLNLWLKRHPGWKKADRIVGCLLGMLEGGMLGVFLIWAVLVIEPIAARHLAEVEASHGQMEVNEGARWIARTAAAVKESAVGRVVRVANPLKELRIFRFFDEAQTVLNDRQFRERFVNHPNMKAIAELPSIKKAQEMLIENSEIINFEDGLSDEELKMLLQDPRFLNILDETKLLEELGPIAYQIQEAFDEALGKDEAEPAATKDP